MSLFSFFNPAKDFALEVAVKLWFNQTQNRYGHMTNIQIDSASSTATTPKPRKSVLVLPPE